MSSPEVLTVYNTVLPSLNFFSSDSDDDIFIVDLDKITHIGVTLIPCYLPTRLKILIEGC